MSKKNKKNINANRKVESQTNRKNILRDFFVEEIRTISNNMWGIYTEDEERKIKEWNEQLGKEDALSTTVFRDAAFLREFLNTIPNKDQFKYVENTYKYNLGNEFDHKYAILTRRAVPSDEPKPEGFWTNEHRVALCGLRQEIPLGSPQRLHSVIMCATLASLEKHGIDSNIRIASDGQVAIDLDKPFKDFLFMYKPEKEKEELEKYLQNGGMSREEVLADLEATAEERRKAQRKGTQIKSTQELGKETLKEQKDTVFLDNIENIQTEQEKVATNEREEDTQK